MASTSATSPGLSDLRPLDPEILNEYLPADIHAIIAQVSTNVDRSLERVIANFRSQVQAEANKFTTGNLPAKLQFELDRLNTQFVADFTAGFAREHAALHASLAKAVAAATAAGAAAPALAKAVSDLATDIAALDAKLKAAKTQVTDLGTKTGKLAAGAAYKAFTGLL